MTDEELVTAITKEFERQMHTPTFNNFYKKALTDRRFAASQSYADAMGQALAKSCKKFITDDIAARQMSAELAQGIIGNNLKRGNALISEVCKIAQDNIYKDLKTGLNAIVPEFDANRAEGLVKLASNAEKFANVQDELYEDLSNFFMHTVDETVKLNADFLRNSGADVAVIREADAGACKWCRALAGRYSGNIPSEVYARHRDCRCHVYYKARYSKTIDRQTEFGWFEPAVATIDARKKHGL